MYAYEGIRLIAANLAKAVNNGTDEDARATGYWQYAGRLLPWAGKYGRGACPILPVGSMFHIAHGLSNALLLPYVMRYNIIAAPARYASVARALGCNSWILTLETAYAGVEKMQLIKQCGIPRKLKRIGRR
jgi:alcohol dehydrogenase class IV